VTKPAWLVIAANAAILFIASLAGWLGKALYGFGCFYSKQPYGSACSPEQGLNAFWGWFIPTAAILYLVWGLAFAARKLMKAK
jgi:hypothetical protein